MTSGQIMRWWSLGPVFSFFKLFVVATLPIQLDALTQIILTLENPGDYLEWHGTSSNHLLASAFTKPGLSQSLGSVAPFRVLFYKGLCCFQCMEPWNSVPRVEWVCPWKMKTPALMRANPLKICMVQFIQKWSHKAVSIRKLLSWRMLTSQDADSSFPDLANSVLVCLLSEDAWSCQLPGG